MSFFLSDDLTSVLTAAKQNPNKQYVGEWCDAWEVDRLNGDSEKCPICGRHVSMLKWLEPRKIRLSNTKYPDRLTSWLSEPLVASQKFIDIYSIEGLTGINLFEPIEVVKVAHKTKNSADPPMYFRAQIDYTQSVRVDAGKTRIHGQESGWSCELCNPWGCTVDHIETLVLDTTNWDGIDIFRVYAIGRVVVSQRFHDAIQKYGLTNFNLVTVEDYRF